MSFATCTHRPGVRSHILRHSCASRPASALNRSVRVTMPTTRLLSSTMGMRWILYCREGATRAVLRHAIGELHGTLTELEKLLVTRLSLPRSTTITSAHHHPPLPTTPLPSQHLEHGGGSVLHLVCDVERYGRRGHDVLGKGRSSAKVWLWSGQGCEACRQCCTGMLMMHLEARGCNSNKTGKRDEEPWTR